jgi:hypothetical protein
MSCRITSNRLSVDQINVSVFKSALMWQTCKAESNTACTQVGVVEQRCAQSFTLATPLMTCAVLPRRSVSLQILKFFWDQTLEGLLVWTL